MRFRKRPVVIEAIQYTGENEREVRRFIGEVPSIGSLATPPKIPIKTLEGLTWASVGDWVIRGVKGEVYPCKPDIFALAYEPADPRPVPESGVTTDCPWCRRSYGSPHTCSEGAQ